MFPDVAFTAFHNSAASSKPWRIRPRLRLSQVKIHARSSKPSLTLRVDSFTLSDRNPTRQLVQPVSFRRSAEIEGSPSSVSRPVCRVLNCAVPDYVIHGLTRLETGL